MLNRLWIVISVVSLGLLGSPPVTGQTPDQQRRDPVPPPGLQSVPPERDVFVPLWTEPVGPDKAVPATIPRQRADYVWSGLSTQSARVEATEHPKGSTALLLSLQPVSVHDRGGQRNWLEVTIRLENPVVRSTRPFLEVVDSATLFQSRAWGRLIRRTPQGGEWLFRVPDPVPPPPGQPNPISARVLRTADPSRKLELRLVSEAPEPP